MIRALGGFWIVQRVAGAHLEVGAVVHVVAKRILSWPAGALCAAATWAGLSLPRRILGPFGRDP